MRVTFLLTGEADLEALSSLDPDEEWRELVLGERAWVLQTYLRLRNAGLPVDVAAAPPPDGILVFHAKQKREILRCGRSLREVALVGVRADLREPLIADFEILQNGHFADQKRRFHVPHWPQPGLVPRDADRGSRIERIAYKGFASNLHPAFRSRRWGDFLARRGLAWQGQGLDYAGSTTDPGPADWADYRDVDLVLAVRPPDRRLHTPKPATKLFNAWLAGAPALLGPEVAYRELRRSPLDYIEVASVADAEEAVDNLQRDPGLYRAMIAHGLERGREFTVETLVPQWADLLFETLPRLAAGQLARPFRRLPPRLTIAARRLARLALLRPAR